jgi:hypothetical protein
MKKAKLVFALLSALALPPALLAAEYGAADSPAADNRAKDVPAPQGQERSGSSVPGAQGPIRDSAESSMPQMFKQLDANRDGNIDTKEAEKSATTKARFKTLDQNRDGKISSEEWKAGGTQ